MTGRRLRRIGPVTAVDSAAAAPPAQWRMRCMCGTILEITSEDDGKRRTCETCRRRFDVQFTEDVATKRKGVSLLYLTDENKRNGSTSSVGAGTTIFQVGPSMKDPNPAGLVMEPELPDEAHFKCACGVLLAISRQQYEKRIRCPECKGRMLVFMLFNSSTGAFTLQLFNLIDAPSGKTQVALKL